MQQMQFLNKLIASNLGIKKLIEDPESRLVPIPTLHFSTVLQMFFEAIIPKFPNNFVTSRPWWTESAFRQVTKVSVLPILSSLQLFSFSGLSWLCRLLLYVVLCRPVVRWEIFDTILSCAWGLLRMTTCSKSVARDNCVANELSNNGLYCVLSRIVSQHKSMFWLKEYPSSYKRVEKKDVY